MAKLKQNTSRQNQILHIKNQIPHGKSKYFTAKTKYLTAKANTHGKTKAILLLLWSIWFCREVFGFAVRYFVFAVRFLVLPWGIFFLPWGFLVWPWRFWFCRDSCGLDIWQRRVVRLIRVPGDHNPLPFGIVACTVFPTTFLEIAVIQLSKGHSRPLLNMSLIIIVINKSTSFQFFSRH